MLIEFSVSNFRSFREKQTFSMVAAPRLVKKGNVFKSDVKGEKIPDLLKVAAIYGPNASGKSNFIKALGIVNELTNSKSPEILPVAPFRFDPALLDQPSRFEFHFIANAQRYEFKFAATSERITEEELVSYPNGKEKLLYSRRHSSSIDQYVFGEDLEGGSMVHDAWKNLTNSKMLFISQAVKNSSEELNQLKIPFQWLVRELAPVPRNIDDLANIVLSLGNKYPVLNLEKYIPSFLHEIDVPVSGMRIEKKSDAGNELPISQADGGLESDNLRKAIDNLRTTLTHKTALGEAQFDLSEESDGTKNLIGFSLLWMALRTAGSQSKVIVVDELDSSLHPKIVACLIDKLLKFDEPAQLIFTTHDTHLMDTKLLRRDQFWLTERDMNGATQLRSVHDFEGREGEDVEKRYYEGRYRGLPILHKS